MRFPDQARRPAAPERSEGAKGLRSLRRETPKVAPGAAEETEGFRGPRSKTKAGAQRRPAGLRSRGGDRRAPERQKTNRVKIYTFVEH